MDIIRLEFDAEIAGFDTWDSRCFLLFVFLESLGFLETCFPPLFSGGVLCLDHIWVFVSSWPEIL